MKKVFFLLAVLSFNAFAEMSEENCSGLLNHINTESVKYAESIDCMDAMGIRKTNAYMEIAITHYTVECCKTEDCKADMSTAMNVLKEISGVVGE